MAGMTKQSQARPAWWRVGVLAFAGAALIGACSSGSSTSSSSSAAPSTTSPSTSPSTTTTASAATCKHVDSLRTSLESLTHVSLNANAAAQIRTDLTNIQTQLTALKGEAGGALSTQLSELTASLNQVEKAAQGLSSNPSSAQVQAIITALSGLKAKSAATISEMNAACPKK